MLALKNIKHNAQKEICLCKLCISSSGRCTNTSHLISSHLSSSFSTHNTNTNKSQRNKRMCYILHVCSFLDTFAYNTIFVLLLYKEEEKKTICITTTITTEVFSEFISRFIYLISIDNSMFMFMVFQIFVYCVCVYILYIFSCLSPSLLVVSCVR